MRIKDIPEHLRPREKALLRGVSTLSTIELLALLISSGTKNKSALDIAAELYTSYHSLKSIANLDVQDFTKIKGFSEAKAVKLCACFELSRRILEETEMWKYEDAKSVFKHFLHLRFLSYETVYIVILNRKMEVIKEKELYKGSSDSVVTSINEILREVMLMNARYFILIHNHPDGIAEPSELDLLTTEELFSKAKEQSIKLLDHIIIGTEEYYSFHEDGIL